MQMFASGEDRGVGRAVTERHNVRDTMLGEPLLVLHDRRAALPDLNEEPQHVSE